MAFTVKAIILYRFSTIIFQENQNISFKTKYDPIYKISKLPLT